MIIGVDKAVANIRGKVNAFRDKRAVFLAATGTMVEVSNRVWNEGKLTSGGSIQYDEDYEVYAYTPPAPRKVTGKGKPYGLWKDQQRAQAIKKAQGGDARKIKGGYYRSYLEFKKQQGRSDNPFELTGRLRKAYLSSPSRPDSVVEVSATEVLVRLRGDEAGKYQGITENKGEFLKLTDEERASFTRRLFEIYNDQN